ncbi:cell division protein FtsZ [candidate division WS6 bacterium RIFOXYD1_FULL_33_8]|uniref:Cell division protein FtsZ n=1 Tax=candidate division WS6 bacterium GW2011_GWC1_33_20 TaxID=1619089 RepID=A0A0F9ZH18_9BACT|nr:MAG: cell division protein FtsZ, cell division protein FtsZ [candidate division WS6 bacterium GW2011_GWE2_33_157]KKP43453.1 MAG: cell division protein FtsZ, cell division protein FtsZ [candidate division WS6 bacterium GW2011_GWC1_33_20]KKP44496.1 MAG: cell division protein FtsZ, cell division protein FtsZ [candidate division WS6 bacterium GW2011_GWF1_33_233]KKP54241.1 MAG: cell division protein FtsZ, cell division protein FtsZ [candidate division WS6 bacterium GW2011_WS6_33_547]KKP56153.1 MA
MLVTTNVDPVAKIKVVGVGGGGCNAINTMISDYDITGVEFMAFNTDAQTLKLSKAPVTLQLGEELTKGLGVGGNHEVGAQAAEESLDQIQEHLEGADMVFITAGMGGGTGTGAAPIIAGVAKNMGALTVAVVTKPFDFEGNRRREIAEEGIASLRDKVDTLIVVPNQRLLEIAEANMSFIDAMKMVDSVLAEGVNSISNLISQTGYINADFNDAKSVMLNAGSALMGIGRASGEKRAELAARAATTSPLLDMSIEGATGVLYNIVGADLSLPEISMVSGLIQEAVDPAANIKFGAQIDPSLGDEIVITIVATGFDENKQVYTKQQKSDEDDDGFGLGGISVKAPVYNKKEEEPVEEKKNNFFDEVEEDFEDESKEEEPDVFKGASKKIDIDMEEDFEDPLDKPAFMRRMFKGKKH